MRSNQHPYAFRFRGNNLIKAKIVNVVPQCYYQDSVQPTGRNWEGLWNDFNWPGWIKPQIDLAFANGANGVKVAWGGWDGATQLLPMATLLPRMRAFNEYVRSLGGCVYWSMLGPQQAFAGDGSLISNGIIPEFQTVMSLIDSFPNTLGVDLLNETNYVCPAAWGNAPGSAFVSSMAAIFGVARAAAPTVPLTASVLLNTYSDWANQWMQNLAPFVDFHDGHPYYQIQYGTPASIPAASDVNALASASWYKGRFFLGEVGCNQGVNTGTQTSFVAGLGALASRPDCYGGNLFAGADFDIADGPSNQWGIADKNVQNPRSPILTPFTNTWPSKLY